MQILVLLWGKKKVRKWIDQMWIWKMKVKNMNKMVLKVKKVVEEENQEDEIFKMKIMQEKGKGIMI